MTVRVFSDVADTWGLTGKTAVSANGTKNGTVELYLAGDKKLSIEHPATYDTTPHRT